MSPIMDYKWTENRSINQGIFMKLLVFYVFFTVVVELVPVSFVWAAVCGKVSSATGDVEILRLKNENDPEGARIAIKSERQSDLWCTDIVVTHQAARAKLRLDKAILTLGPNSRLEVAAEVKGSGTQTLALPYGKVRTFFQGDEKAGQAARFKVKTPAAVVGVRGTDFYVTYKPNEKVSEQATLTGRVEVTQKTTNLTVQVDKGQQVTVDNFAAKLEEKNKEDTLAREKKKAEELALLEKEKLNEDARKKAIAELEEKTRLEELAQKQAAEEGLRKKTAEQFLVKQIDKLVAEEIKQTSVLVKNDAQFTSKEAVDVLGAPNTWLPPPNEEVPDKYKGYENKF